MTTLLPEEQAALIAALETGRVKSMFRLIELGLIYIGPHPTIQHESKLQLTPAGQIVATLLKRESRLERLLDDARVCFVADTVMTEQQVRIRDRVEYAVGATTRDPDATIEASKRTPWPVEE